MQSQLDIESWTMVVPEVEPHIDQSRETVHSSRNVVDNPELMRLQRRELMATGLMAPMSDQEEDKAPIPYSAPVHQ